MPTIALVDDDRNILTSVSMALEAEGYQTSTYTDGVASGSPGQPGRCCHFRHQDAAHGRMELLRRLRQRSDMPVIFLTFKDDEIDELFGFKMGADDFIRKPFSQRLLVERVKAVLRRAQQRDGSVTAPEPSRAIERGKLVMDPDRHSCTWDGQAVTLTVTEFLILQSLAQRPGIVKSRDALMDAAYDDQVYVDDRTSTATSSGSARSSRWSTTVSMPPRRCMASAIASRRLEKSGPRTSGSLHRARGVLTAAMVAIETRDRVEVDDFCFVGRCGARRAEFLCTIWRRLTSPAASSCSISLASSSWSGILYFSQSRESLISARVQSLMTQGHIMAAAIASSATVDTGEIVIDPDKLLEPSEEAGDVDVHNLDFLINPERAGPVLRRLVSSTDRASAAIRARIFDREGRSSSTAAISMAAATSARRAAAHRQGKQGVLTTAWNAINDWLFTNDYPVQKEYGLDNGKDFRRSPPP